MTVPHDDYPHPVPPLASLRWKENWLFIIMDVERKVFGVVHINTEPAFDRARFTCNFNIDGRIVEHESETSYPVDFAWSPTIACDAIRLHIVQPDRVFELDIRTYDLTAQLRFECTFATFDFAACRSGAPHNMSFRELMTLGTNLPHDHHQQALTVTGTLTVAGGTALIRIDGPGYRDHSFCMRGDSLIGRHSWCALLFEKRVIGVKTATILGRPGAEAREGYVDDAAGPRILTDVVVEQRGGGPDGLGETVLFTLRDVAGRAFTVEADVSGRFSHLTLASEKPGKRNWYKVVESLCPIRLVETGEIGLGHIELGINSALVT